MRNKIISFVLIMVIILPNITVLAQESEKSILKCIDKQWFELYKCQKREICQTAEYWQSKEKITKLEKQYKKDTTFEEAKKIYSYNQNRIYNCAILNSQEKAFNDLIIRLVNLTDKTGILKSRIVPRINSKKEKIKKIKEKHQCKDVKEKSKIKKIVLDQTTLELCYYKFFLEYLKNQNLNNLAKNFPKEKSEMSALELSLRITANNNKIDEEISRSISLYSTVFETYIQYDSFFKIHIILKILKENYRILRNKLYKTLHPINQVIYKIINAQSK